MPEAYTRAGAGARSPFRQAARRNPLHPNAASRPGENGKRRSGRSAPPRPGSATAPSAGTKGCTVSGVREYLVPAALGHRRRDNARHAAGPTAHHRHPSGLETAEPPSPQPLHGTSGWRPAGNAGGAGVAQPPLAPRLLRISQCHERKSRSPLRSAPRFSAIPSPSRPGPARSSCRRTTATTACSASRPDRPASGKNRSRAQSGRGTGAADAQPFSGAQSVPPRSAGGVRRPAIRTIGRERRDEASPAGPHRRPGA